MHVGPMHGQRVSKVPDPSPGRPGLPTVPRPIIKGAVRVRGSSLPPSTYHIVGPEYSRVEKIGIAVDELEYE